MEISERTSGADIPVIVVAAGFLVDAIGRVLLGLRASDKIAWPNCWDAIGGRLEPGETAQDALRREIQEELGVIPTKFEPLAVLECPDASGAGLLQRHIFAISGWVGGEPQNVSDEHSALRWFTLEEMLELPNLSFDSAIQLAGLAVAAGQIGRL